jgi:hypothetical protein
VVRRVLELTAVDFIVIEAVCTEQRQAELKVAGKRKMLDSPPTGLAVDLLP